MILLPSRGRPHLLKRFFDCGKPVIRGMVILDDDDKDNYKSVEIPSNWSVVSFPRKSIASHINAVLDGSEVFGLMNDDAVPMTPSWDEMLVEHAKKRGIAWPDDGWHQKCTFPFVRGDIVRGFGWYAYPPLKHLYIDTVWGDLAEAAGINGFMPNVIVKHLHSSNGGPQDDTYMQRVEGGQTEYLDFKANHLRDHAERLHGIR